jgi:hypothetical protein
LFSVYFTEGKQNLSGQFVYFAYDKLRHKIKIGRTSNWYLRLAEYNKIYATNDRSISLVFIFLTCEITEKIVHEYCKADKVDNEQKKNEWYHVSDSLLELINKLVCHDLNFSQLMTREQSLLKIEEIRLFDISHKQ